MDKKFMRAGMTFDTLAYANRLKAAGVDPVIAEAQAEANAELIDSLIQNKLATKDDFANYRQATKDDIANLAQATKDDIANLKQTTKDDIANLKYELSGEISRLDTKIVEVEGRVGQQLKDLEIRLTLRLGGITVGSMGIFATILSVLHVAH